MDDGGIGLSVSEAATAVGLTAHTLRWYEQEGLVHPVGRDSAGRRVYREFDLAWIRTLIRLKNTGMPVREMRRYAELAWAGSETYGERLRLFEEHRDRVRAQIVALQTDLAVIESKIEYFHREMEHHHDEVTTAG